MERIGGRLEAIEDTRRNYLCRFSGTAEQLAEKAKFVEKLGRANLRG